MHRALFSLSWVSLVAVLVAACYYSPQTRRAKADSSYMSEAEAAEFLQAKLAPHGIKFVSNMKLERAGAKFEADGYDSAIRVGFEYLSHEGSDFEGEDDQSDEGLTTDEIEALKRRQKVHREFFVFIKEGKKEDVERAVDAFVEELFNWEVLRRKAKTDSDGLFPDDAKKKESLLPWESTGSLKKKREEMEIKERASGSGPRLDKAEGLGSGVDEPLGIEPGEGVSDEPASPPVDEDSKKRKPEPSTKQKKTTDDDWGDEGSEDLDF